MELKVWRLFVLARSRADLSTGLAVWTSFIFPIYFKHWLQISCVHQIKKIALNYPINIIIFAAPSQHYIMEQRGFYPAQEAAALLNENWIVIMQPCK